jgi:predicted RNA-binding protein with RPS1 domain
MNMHVRTIEDIDWCGEEVYFTVISEDGITGKVQLNMRSIINDYSHYVEWEEEEE